MFGLKGLIARLDGHEQRLLGIQRRIDSLESAPKPDLDLQPIRASLIDLRENHADVSHRLESLFENIGELAAQAKDFTMALSEGIERTDRAERRIKATVARARKELKARGYEDPGLDAEAYELRDVDGKGGDDPGVLPLRGPVGQPTEDASSIRGVSLEELRRVRGL